MAKFSLFTEDDDDEAPRDSKRHSKRQRTICEEQTQNEDDENIPEESEGVQEAFEDDPSEEGEFEEVDGEGEEEGQEVGDGSEEENATPLPPAIETPTADGAVSVRLSVPEVLDCPICFEPLTLPVFQCENGHVACSSCCIKLTNKCPSCCFPIGYNRCRAIEKVLESLQTSCPNIEYGCKENIRYSELRNHNRVCNFAPCTCPFPECNFRESLKQLSKHIRTQHPECVKDICYNICWRFSMNASDRFLVLCERQGELFILTNRAVLLGNVMVLSRICSNSSKGELPYELNANCGHGSLTLLSSTENTPGKMERPCSKGFLLVPACYMSTSLHLDLEIRISNSELSKHDP